MSDGETPSPPKVAESMSVETAREILESTDPESVSEAQAKTAFHCLVRRGDRSEKILKPATLPPLNLDHEHLTSENMHPVIIEGATSESITARDATVDVPLIFRDCEIDHVDLSGAQFVHDIGFTDSSFGSFRAEEAKFEHDVDFTNASFRDRVEMDETLFSDDARFRGVTFESEALFRLATFDGASNELDDNADFSEAEFCGPARFDRADFGCATFANCTATEKLSFRAATVSGELLFESGTLDGAVTFESAEFEGLSVFDNTRFNESVTFQGSSVLEVSFKEAVIEGRASFDESQFADVASFRDTVFKAVATFDDARFDHTADFTNAAFEAAVSFEKVRFQVSDTQSKTDTVFAGTRFAETADFNRSTIGSIEFTENDLPDRMHFRETLVLGYFDAKLHASEPIYLDFTGAKIKQGIIKHSSGDPLWIDFTEASLGDLLIRANDQTRQHSLLDRVRFCDTEFSEFDGERFDFSAYTSYFDRNEWALHAFEEPPHVESFATPLTSKNIERTYLKAKNAATATGFDEAAGEFRVKRQRWARKNHFEIFSSRTESTISRVKSLSRALENLFLDMTCGYGVRLGRILFVFLIVPLIPALLFVFGGRLFETGAGQIGTFTDLLTASGQSVLVDNIYFSYVTFLTVGYGNIRPIAPLARLVAGVEVYLNVILGGLVIYSLIKRSEL
jgi:uncharacterized protein YjbI with pentapeptide repeats